MFFQSDIVYLVQHVSHKGICPSKENMHAEEEFPMPETFTQVCTFCGLWFITGVLSRDLLTSLGHSTMYLPPEAWEVVRILKDKIKSIPVLVFPDFDKPFLLETDASKEGLGAVLFQKQDDGCYHPIMFGSHSLMPSEKNYHSSKLEFLALKWSVTEHFKEYLTYTPFVVWTDNNLLTYVHTTPNLNATGHRWIGMLASFEFMLEYQKGADNGAVDALSWVPICHD